MLQALAARRSQPHEAEQVVGELAADEEHHERREHERAEHERERHVDRLAPPEAAPVARRRTRRSAPGARPPARRSCRTGRRATLSTTAVVAVSLWRNAVRSESSIGAIAELRRDVAQIAQDRVVGARVLPDQGEQRDAQQDGREERHQRVVGERRRVLGHLVVVERLQRPPQDPSGAADRGASRTGSAAALIAGLSAGAGAPCRAACVLHRGVRDGDGLARAEQLRDRLAGARPREVEALAGLAAELAQRRRPGPCVSTPSAIVSRPRLWARLMIAVTIAMSSASGVEAEHEGAVDLEHVEREALERAQRRVAGAELVDREPHAERPSAGRSVAIALSASSTATLSVISRHSGAGLRAGLGQHALDQVDEAGVAVLAGREVHGDAQRAAVADRPRARLQARLAQRPTRRCA